MQIVIDIPEEVYKAYKLNSNLSFLNSDQQSFARGHLINGLVNGTPLPEGLILVDKFIDNLKGIERLHINDELRNSILNALYASTLETESENKE